ncbi:MAG: hypothetical protein HOO06_13890 [Bdellovibrionaceae bacterium]|jgi:hypothetical protein|nr:hypothetical protein [Pseudobdellovibrionaceae bacterium]
MDVQYLDFIFPFIVLFYGFVMTVVLHSATMMKIAEDRFPDYWLKRFRSHQTLGLICLVVGAFWSLQNIWAN